MFWFHKLIQRDAGMGVSNRKLLVLTFLLFLSHLACDADSVSDCCRQPGSACRLYVLLCRSSSRAPGGPLSGDAAAGILTVGKRKEEDRRLQSRLHQLLHGSRNQAAGILTVGRRTEEGPVQQYMDRMTKSDSITAASRQNTS
ncbi:orexin isoform X2 [Thalassophryne amazonica]|uniref:orexin isoform X2 n=1 Tax=Thalassophryne amazonica TaxID=390379 RepID=UPI001470FA9E|nr:orexin isoform X2 [Thalassophryne amazonica]